jgi:hypothetical protein
MDRLARLGRFGGELVTKKQVASPKLDHWSTRFLLAVGFNVTWFLLAGLLGRLSSFPLDRSATELDAIAWAIAGALGLGTFAGLLLLRTKSGRPLLPIWTLLAPGLLSLGASYLLLLLTSDDRGAYSFFESEAVMWVLGLHYPVTVALCVAVLLNRYLPRGRRVTAIAAFVVTVLPWPIFLFGILQGSLCC